MRTKIFTKLLLFLLFVLGGLDAHSQGSEMDTLFFDSFNQGSRFNMNFGQPGFPPVIVNNNNFIINNIYQGIDSFPSAPDQEQAEGGKILLPNTGNYLHIYSTLAQRENKGYVGPNFNAADSGSTNAINFNGNEFCGIPEIEVSFYWACEGNEEAFGELWYSIDFQEWKKYDKLKLHNQKTWKREVISDTAFNNKMNVRFAFHWENGKSDSKVKTLPLMIDDFLVRGKKDVTKNNIKIVPKSNIICKGDFAEYFIIHERMECTWANYQILLSDEKGQFLNPPIGNFFLGPGNTQDTFKFSINYTDPEMILGDCYKVRIIRQGNPLDTFETECTRAMDCGPIIRTIEPPNSRVDTLGICVNSVFDVPYNLIGNFATDNKVVAQLSDMNGSFDKPVEIGAITSNEIKSGINPDTWGWVLGRIPKTTVPGCGYRVRVVTTSPVSVSKEPSPSFCIRQCDIESNGLEDLNICQYSDIDDSLLVEFSYRRHTWNDKLVYNSDNEFELQFINRDFFNVVFQNPFAKIKLKSTEDGTLSFKIGKYPDLRDRFNLPPGNYYVRVISTSRDSKVDTMGTLVRFDYNSVSEKTKTILIDSILCKPIEGDTTEMFTLQIQDYDWQGNSEYEFYWGNAAPNDPPQIYPRRFITFDGRITWTFQRLGANVTQKYITYRVQERTPNKSCFSVKSDVDTIWIIDHDPKVDFLGFNDKPCIDDKNIRFNVTKIPGCKYEFTSTNGGVINSQNYNIAEFSFPKEGRYEIRCKVYGPCGGVGEIARMITIVPAPTLVVTSDKQTICRGDTAVITVKGAKEYTWGEKETLNQDFGDEVRATPIKTTTYTVVGINGTCSGTASVTITVKDSPEQPVFTRIPKTDSLRCFQDYDSYQWILEDNDIPGATNKTYLMKENGKYRVRVANAGGCESISPPSNMTISGRDDAVVAALNLKLFPNPARDNTQLSYLLQAESQVSVSILDVQGRLLYQVIDEVQAAGFQRTNINFKNLGLAAGSYALQIKVGNISTVVRVAVVD